MVLADLSGIQQTLDLYGIKHDTFDFESELGWEVRVRDIALDTCRES